MLGELMLWQHVVALGNRFLAGKKKKKVAAAQGQQDDNPPASILIACLSNLRFREVYSVKQLCALMTFEAKHPWDGSTEKVLCKDYCGPGCKDCKTCHFCRQKTVGLKTRCKRQVVLLRKRER